MLDLIKTYYQISLMKDCEHVTPFCTDWNLLEFNSVPFGAATGAAVLSHILDYVLGIIAYLCL